MRRHQWDAAGYAVKHRACKRCGVTASTFGVGAWRTWTYRDENGRYLGIRSPDCTPEETHAGDRKGNDHE